MGFPNFANQQTSWGCTSESKVNTLQLANFRWTFPSCYRRIYVRTEDVSIYISLLSVINLVDRDLCNLRVSYTVLSSVMIHSTAILFFQYNSLRASAEQQKVCYWNPTKDHRGLPRLHQHDFHYQQDSKTSFSNVVRPDNLPTIISA